MKYCGNNVWPDERTSSCARVCAENGNSVYSWRYRARWEWKAKVIVSPTSWTYIAATWTRRRDDRGRGRDQGGLDWCRPTAARYTRLETTTWSRPANTHTKVTGNSCPAHNAKLSMKCRLRSAAYVNRLLATATCDKETEGLRCENNEMCSVLWTAYG